MLSRGSGGFQGFGEFRMGRPLGEGIESGKRGAAVLCAGVRIGCDLGNAHAVLCCAGGFAGVTRRGCAVETALIWGCTAEEPCF